MILYSKGANGTKPMPSVCLSVFCQKGRYTSTVVRDSLLKFSQIFCCYAMNFSQLIRLNTTGSPRKNFNQQINVFFNLP